LRRPAGQSGVVLAGQGAGTPTRAVKKGADGKDAAQHSPTPPKAATPAKPVAMGQHESLREGLLRVLKQAKQPVKARELAERVLATGYQTTSKDFVNVVWVALGKLDEAVKVAGEGWRLKKAPNAK